MNMKRIEITDRQYGGNEHHEAVRESAAENARNKGCRADSSLEIFSEIVTAMRSPFFDYLRSLPAPCGDDLIRHFSARVARSQGRPVLGEYAPFMLCDILGISTQKAGEIAVPWLMLYETSALTDDLADLQVEDRAKSSFLLQLVFTEAMYCWKGYLERFPFLWDELRRFQQEAVCAAYSELTDTNPKDGWRSSGLAFGRKPALANFCASALCALGCNRRLTQAESEGLDHLCTVVQLLDDVTDSNSDLQLAQSNYVADTIVCWLRNLRSSAQLHAKDVSNNEAIACLVISGTLRHVAKLVVDYTRSGLNLLKVSDHSLTMDYFSSQVKKCERMVEEERRLWVECADGIAATRRALSDSSVAFERYLKTPSGDAVWQNIKKCHSLIPQASQ